jgi:hypothetical protein
MRTLKKTLCLVLALALCFSLASVAFASNVDDFTDAEEVGTAYEEAVAVLIGTGIVNGKTDTTIAPTETFTREEAAKIVAYMTLGETVAKALTTTSSSFKDVAATRWSAPFIEYCVAQGYVKGYGDGNFGPSDELTGLQFAAMLLRVLGFDGEYEGSSWSINVLKDALTNGIFTGDAGAATNDAAERQQAMLMAFNAINYTAAGSKTTYTVTSAGGSVIYQGTNETLAAAANMANAGSTITESTTNVNSLGDKNYGLTPSTSTDEFGRVSKTYTNGQVGSKLVTYASFAPTAVVTYTEQTTDAKIAAAVGATASTNVELTVITDGSVDTSYNTTGTKSVNKATTPTNLGAQGTLIEVYANGTNGAGEAKYNVIVINTYVTTLVAGNIHAAVAATATTDAADAYVTLEAGVNYVTSAFKAGDVIIYTKGKNASGTTVAVSVAKADSIEGTVTAVGASNAYIKVDGKQYSKARANAGTFGSGNYAIDSNRTYFLDFYGNIIADAAAGSVAVDTKYIYVVEVKESAGSTTGATDLFGTGGTTSDPYAQARVIDLATGELKIVDLAVVKNAAGASFFATTTGAVSAVAVDGTVTHASEKVYKYAEVDGKIALDGTTGETGTNVTINKGKGDIATGNYVNASTVLTVVDYTKTGATITSYTGASVTTYTGVANFPALGALTGVAYYTADATTGLVANVLIVKQAVATTTANYAIYKAQGETTATTVAQEFYVKGEVVSYTDDDNYSTGTTAWAADTVYDLTIGTGTLDGAVISALAMDGVSTVSGVVKTVTDTYVVVTISATDYVVYLADGYQAYDKTNSYAATTIAAGDTISVYGGTVAAGVELVIKTA